MASNDSGAAVAAATPVNAVTPILSQTENKASEAAKANHDTSLSSTTQQATATVPVTAEASESSAKDASKTTPASNNTSTTSIPSSTTAETNSSVTQPAETDSSQSQSQSKPNEGEDENKNTTSTTTTTTAPTAKVSNDTTNADTSAQSKLDGVGDKEQKKGSETVQNQEDKKTDQQHATAPVEESKTSSEKKEQTASESLPSNTNNTKTSNSDNSKTDKDKTSVSGSDKSEKTQNATSLQAEAPSVKTTPLAPTTTPSKPIATIKPMVDSTTTASNDAETPMDTSTSKSNSTSNNPKSSNKRPADDGDTPSEKKIKSSSSASSSSGGGQKEGNKSAEQVLEYMEKTFDQRRKIITKQMPTIPELKSMYPELFMGKQLLLEFQRITKIDIDQKIQEFCVRYATAVIEMARSNKAAAPVLARWEQAKQENETLKQYWDMVTALCLLPLHFGENFVEMVLEIGEDEEVKAQGKIVPTLVARGNIFRTDEFFLIAENTIVQEFEEFTIAFASLYSSYWVFNMVYPETIENTYNYIQRCIVRQREPGAISAVCKNFTKSLQKWNKEKEGK